MQQTETVSKQDWLSQVLIRHLTEADLSALEWDGEFTHFRRVYSEAYQRAERGLSVLWVAELPHVGIIGQVFVQLTCDRPELADGARRAYFFAFRIRPAFRRAGLGSLMLNIIEEDLRRRGFFFVTLNVAKDNLEARELYERRSYHVIAHEPGCWSYQDERGYWRQVEEPAWRMEKKLFNR